MTQQSMLPFLSLTPDGFEVFCLELLRALDATSNTFRFGVPGDRQEGVDIKSIDREGHTRTYQCKRYKRFGPADLRKAIAAHTHAAERKHILLACKAQASLRKEVETHPEWELWDAEDISCRVLDLPIEVSVKLLERHLPGARESFLGIPRPTSWSTAEEYFRTQLGEDSPFTHRWSLVGRSKELESLHMFLGSSSHKIALVVANPGLGKSRLLKELADTGQKVNGKSVLRFLDRSAQLTKRDLECLEGGEWSVVLDDAHDNQHLLPTLELILRSPNISHVILAIRPYAREFVLQQLGECGVFTRNVAELNLAELSPDEAQELIWNALGRPKGIVPGLSALNAATRACPLIGVMVAHFMVHDQVGLFEAISEKELWRFVAARFQSQICSVAKDPIGREAAWKLFQFLAAAQPVGLDSIAFRAQAEQFTSIPWGRVEGWLDRWTSDGLLRRAFGATRIVPDLLGDAILYEACFLKSSGQDSEFLKQLLAAAAKDQFPGLLENLCRMQWRFRDQGEGSPLLREKLIELCETFETSSHKERARVLELLGRVAAFHPKLVLSMAVRVLDFLKVRSSQGEWAEDGEYYRFLLNDLINVFVSVGHAPSLFKKVAEILIDIHFNLPETTGWLNLRPLKALLSLGEFGYEKPFTIQEDFLGLLEGDFRGKKLLPVDWFEDALNQLLARSFEHHEQTGMKIQIAQCLFDPQIVHGVRTRALQLAFDLLQCEEVTWSCMGMRAIETALRDPTPFGSGTYGPEITAHWHGESVAILEKLLALIQSEIRDPILLARVRHSLRWHAALGDPMVGEKAKQVIEAMPRGRSLSLTSALWPDFVDLDRDIEQGIDDPLDRRQRVVDRTIIDLNLGGEDADALLCELDGLLVALQRAEPKGHIDPTQFLLSLLDSVRGFDTALIEGVIKNEVSGFGFGVGSALNHLSRRDLLEVDRYMEALLDAEHVWLRSAAFAFPRCFLGRTELLQSRARILSKFTSSSNPQVIESLIHGLHGLKDENPGICLDTIQAIPTKMAMKISESVFSEVLQLPIAAASDPGLLRAKLNEILVALPQLDGFFVQRFLASGLATNPHEVLDLLLERAVGVAKHEPVHSQLRRMGGDSIGEEVVPPDLKVQMLHRWKAALSSKLAEGSVPKHLPPAILAYVMGNDWYPLLPSLIAWAADEQCLTELRIALPAAPPDFLWAHPYLVEAALSLASTRGDDYLKSFQWELQTALSPHQKSGSPGEPFPQDIALKERAQAWLSKARPGSLLAGLSTALVSEANREIQRAIEMGY